MQLSVCCIDHMNPRVRMVRDLAPEMIVPQHGLPMKGQAMRDFLDWLEGLECGIDLMTQANYRSPLSM